MKNRKCDEYAVYLFDNVVMYIFRKQLSSDNFYLVQYMQYCFEWFHNNLVSYLHELIVVLFLLEQHPLFAELMFHCRR